MSASEKEVNEEFDEAFKVLNDLYMPEVTESVIEKRSGSQLSVWKNSYQATFWSFHHLAN